MNMLRGDHDVILEIKKSERNKHQGRKRCFCPPLPNYKNSARDYDLSVRIWNDDMDQMEYWKGRPNGWGPSVFDDAMECFNNPGCLPSRLQRLLVKCSARSKQQLCLAWGVGVKTASRLFNLGVKNVDDLRDMLLDEDKMDDGVMRLLTRGVPKRIHPIRWGNIQTQTSGTKPYTSWRQIPAIQPSILYCSGHRLDSQEDCGGHPP
jgi:hypothetical protein